MTRQTKPQKYDQYFPKPKGKETKGKEREEKEGRSKKGKERRDEDKEGGREGRKDIYVISQVGIYFRFFLLL